MTIPSSRLSLSQWVDRLARSIHFPASGRTIPKKSVKVTHRCFITTITRSVFSLPKFYSLLPPWYCKPSYVWTWYSFGICIVSFEMWWKLQQRVPMAAEAMLATTARDSCFFPAVFWWRIFVVASAPSAFLEGSVPHRDRRNVMTAVHLCWLLYTHLLVDLNSSVRDFVKGACFSFGDCLVSGSHAVDLGMTRELCVTSIAYSSFSFPTSVLL